MTDLYFRFDRAAGGLSDQIADELRCAIRAGRLTRGMPLPATRALACDLDVSRGVIVEAYEQLVAEGFLVSRQGSGTRVADVEPAAAPPPPAAPQPDMPTPVAYDLTIGTPDLSVFPRQQWLAAMREVLRVTPHDAFDYADPGGVAELRGVLADYLRRVRCAGASADDIVVVNGVGHGLSLVVGALVRAGHHTVAVEDPHSRRAYRLIEAAGARPVSVPVDAEGISVAALRSTPATAVLVTPAHQYPTGVVLSPRRRADLVAWAGEVDGLVLEDDYDAEFRYDRDPVGCLQGLCPDRVVLLGSVSKSLAPGLRLGWLVAPPGVAAAVRAARVDTDRCSPVLDQLALAHLIDSGAYDRQVRKMRRRYRSRRDALVGALARFLPEVVVRGVSAGIQLYVELPAGTDEAAVVAAAARRGVAVEGIADTRIGGGPPGLTLSFARLPEHRITAAVRLLAEAVHAG